MDKSKITISKYEYDALRQTKLKYKDKEENKENE